MMCDIVIAADDASFLGDVLVDAVWHGTFGLGRSSLGRQRSFFFAVEYVTGKEAEQISIIKKTVPLESLED